MSVVTPEVVKEVAFLTRLRLEGKELEHLAHQIDQILEYVRQLETVPTDNVEPTSHVLALSNVLRKDEQAPHLSQDAVVALAPDSHPPFVKVPKVIESV